MSQGESHYDLYASLGLDREKSAAEIAGELDSRLERLSGEGKTVADPAYDEASTARTILGDPRRRRLYDERLASPTPPAIGIDELRGLAQLPESALPPLEDEDEKDAPSAESPADAYYGQQAQQPYADPATEQYPAAGQQQPGQPAAPAAGQSALQGAAADVRQLPPVVAATFWVAIGLAVVGALGFLIGLWQIAINSSGERFVEGVFDSSFVPPWTGYQFVVATVVSAVVGVSVALAIASFGARREPVGLIVGVGAAIALVLVGLVSTAIVGATPLTLVGLLLLGGTIAQVVLLALPQVRGWFAARA